MENKKTALMPDQELVRLAKQMVLAEFNRSRTQAQQPRLTEVPSSWWLIHGHEVLEVARVMKVVTIISLWSALGRATAPVRYDVLAEDGDVETTLQDAYVVTNVDGRPMGKQACATTTGDLMVLDGQHYLVEHIGFHVLTEVEAQAILQLSALQTSWGYDRLVRDHLI